MVMSISPGALCPSDGSAGFTEMYFWFIWNRPRKSTKSLLMKRICRR